MVFRFCGFSVFLWFWVLGFGVFFINFSDGHMDTHTIDSIYTYEGTQCTLDTRRLVLSAIGRATMAYYTLTFHFHFNFQFHTISMFKYFRLLMTT